jgi:hypothetical protein
LKGEPIDFWYRTLAWRAVLVKTCACLWICRKSSHSTNKQADIYLHKKALDDLPDLVCIEPILNWFSQSWTKRKAIRTMRWRS